MRSSKRSLWTMALVAALLVVTGSAPVGAIPWLKSVDHREPWELALDLAKRNREPVMAFIYDESRQLTQMMDNLTLADEAVNEAAKRFLCVRVDVFRFENGPFLDRYGVRRTEVQRNEQVEVGRGQAYPVTLFISPSGAVEHMVYGFVPVDAFLKIMDQSAEIIELREKLEDAPEDARTLARLGGLYVELQRYPAGREALEKALELDAEHALGVAETGLLDLAVAVMADEDHSRVIELLSTHIATFPESELRCKAHFLLGGAMLAAAETTQFEADQLAATDETGAVAARQNAQLQRRQALEAWQWFSGDEDSPGPCAESEWAAYSLGTLEQLRMEIAFREAENLAAAGDPDDGINALREFIKEFRSSEIEGAAGRVYNAEFLIGKRLMASEEWAGAADHWRSFINRYPPKPTGTRVAEPEFADTCEAMFLLGECLLRLGRDEQAVNQWRVLGSDNQKNPCLGTPWVARGAVEADFLTGERFMTAEKWAEAANHWTGFLDRYVPEPTENAPAPRESERACQARFLLGECLLKLGRTDEARKAWQALAAESEQNACRATSWPVEAARALEANK